MTAGNRAVALLSLLAVLLLAPAAAVAQNTDADARAACGRKATESGLGGKGLVSDFVADCVAAMKSNKAGSRGTADGKGKSKKDMTKAVVKKTKSRKTKKGE